MPEDLDLIFVTCPRTPSYFPTTLASALLADALTCRLKNISVCVDSPNLECVELLTAHTRITWAARDEEQSQMMKEFPIHQRACFSYWRALGFADAEARATIVCEDDIIFRDGWLTMLLSALDEMSANSLEDFVLSAYSAHDHEIPAFRRGEYYSSYVAHQFFGTQIMIFSSGEIDPMKEIIWTSGVVRYEEPYDLLLRRRMIRNQHLYTTRHSLVQHVGMRSTGLGYPHTSPSFRRAWPE